MRLNVESPELSAHWPTRSPGVRLKADNSCPQLRPQGPGGYPGKWPPLKGAALGTNPPNGRQQGGHLSPVSSVGEVAPLGSSPPSTAKAIGPPARRPLIRFKSASKFPQVRGLLFSRIV